MNTEQSSKASQQPLGDGACGTRAVFVQLAEEEQGQGWASKWCLQYRKEERRQMHLTGYSKRTRDSEHKLQQGKFLLDRRKTCSSPRMSQRYNRCPQKLGNLHVWGYSLITWSRPWMTRSSLGVSPAVSRVLDCRTPAVFSYLNLSVSLTGLFVLSLLVDFGDCVLFIFTSFLPAQNQEQIPGVKICCCRGCAHLSGCSYNMLWSLFPHGWWCRCVARWTALILRLTHCP